MTVYSADQIGNLWIAAGGDPTWARKAEAVALAESGGNSDARSSTTDFGLWQINAIHFGDGIIDASNWATPTVNARAAISISSNGTNWAAWCTCWDTPDKNCGHGQLSTPQATSPAGRELAALGGTPSTSGGGGGGGTSHTTSAQATWSQVQTDANQGALDVQSALGILTDQFRSA